MNENKFITNIQYTSLWLLFFLFFEVATGWVRGYISLRIDIIFMFLKCFLFTILVWKKWQFSFKHYLIALNTFYGIILLIFLYHQFIRGETNTVSWPNDLFAIVGGWGAVVFTHFKSRMFKGATLLGSIVLLYFVIIEYDYVAQFNTYQTFAYKQKIWINPDSYSLTNKDGDTLKFERDILYVIDFWYTRCGICYEEFPVFESWYKRNKNPKNEFIAVNYPIEIDSNREAFVRIQKLGYQFPVLKGSPSIASAFGIKAYPTLVVLKNDTLLFRGISYDMLKRFLRAYNSL